jgi:CTP synthase
MVKNKEISKPAKITKTKYVFVVGGVISGVGKGVTTSTLALLCKQSGYKVTAIKIDPYINVDAGTMNPTEHGEVFVLADGDECDQDMGNYERFLGDDLSRTNYMTTGRVYQSVIEKERSMYYKGLCVEVVPHIPMEVIERIERAAAEKQADISFVEIGGTVGEYQNMLFLEAVRMMEHKLNSYDEKNIAVVMVSYVPNPPSVGELKTKPTQHAVRELNAVGIQPDIIIARSDISLDEKRKEKIAMFCNVQKNHVFSAPDVKSIYDIPENFKKEKVHEMILKKLQLVERDGKDFVAPIKTDLSKWNAFFKPINPGHQQDYKVVNVAIIGKYFESGSGTLSDSYLSVIEAIKYSACALKVQPKITWLSAENIEKGVTELEELKKFDAVIVPGGFGARGVVGKMQAIKYVRENKIPFLGICYGMQLALVEYARDILNLKDANTTEVDPKTTNPVITILEDQKEKMKSNNYGNTMRLGAYNSVVKKKTLAYELYKKTEIVERHRHRFEVNPEYHKAFEEMGIIFSSTSPDGTLAEIIELPQTVHPYFIAGQFHPEFLARPLDPHPLFTGLIKAALRG